MLKRIMKSKHFSEKKVFIEPKDKEKMSEIITEFAEPLLNACNDDETTKKAIIIAIAVWNASLLSKKEQKYLIQEIIPKLSPSDNAQDVAITLYYIKQLLERKKKLFPNNNRVIVDYQFSGTGKKFRLLVASTVSL